MESHVHRQFTDAYLDIETTGLSRFDDAITVIGIYLCSGRDNKLVQLWGRQVKRENLLTALEGVKTIYTYNGSRFDLPFINTYLRTNLIRDYAHRDLMFDCWRCNLKGGFKRVEQQLDIPRRLKGINGFDAVMLWWQYQNTGNRGALEKLLQYNKEDVVNLKVLRERLEIHRR